MKKKNFAVIGLGRFGLEIARTLSELKRDVIAIDINEERVSKAAEFNEYCVIADATNMSSLKELDVDKVDHAIVAIGNNFQATILATINLKELGVKNITVRVDSEEHIKVMERIGATEVIIPEVESALSLAHQIISDNILDYYQINKKFGIAQVKVSEDFQAKTLIELDSRNEFEINIIGISRKNKFFIPRGTDKVEPNDTVLVVGETTKIAKFENFLN